jgi:hypothetical protein
MKQKIRKCTDEKERYKNKGNEYTDVQYEGEINIEMKQKRGALQVKCKMSDWKGNKGAHVTAQKRKDR